MEIIFLGKICIGRRSIWQWQLLVAKQQIRLKTGFNRKSLGKEPKMSHRGESSEVSSEIKNQFSLMHQILTT
jgi:hypothetical protein